MVEIVVVAVIVASAAVPFFLCCCSIARAAFVVSPLRAEAQTAAFWGVALAVIVIGCTAVSNARNDEAAALLGVTLCIASLPFGMALSKSWRAAEAIEAVRVAELRTLVERYRLEVDSLEARCARVARSRDLTRREEDVLVLLLQGCTRAEIARALVVSADTVKTHIRNLYRKLDIAGKGELAGAVDRSVS